MSVQTIEMRNLREIRQGEPLSLSIKGLKELRTYLFVRSGKNLLQILNEILQRYLFIGIDRVPLNQFLSVFISQDHTGQYSALLM